ncbi:MAG: DUF2807 domain-containing protein [Alphaproteobacteria bacterium]|nr:DUF2807 domain-containing protein [Alphaproteobacteria bacterium]HPF45402.1 head GIN domain-containing protein [Emcibacteraceae bacterium]HRW29304.1 head GIN domain-containing protein [Emcibacteraceae bacterium]
MTNFISKFPTFLISIMVGSIIFFQFAQADEIKVKHDLEDFNQIRIDNIGVQLDVTVGKKFSIEVEGEEELVNTLLLKVRGHKLVLYRDDEKHFWDKGNNDSTKVIISMPEFTGFDLRGAVDAHIKGVDSDKVEFDLKGAGNINIEGKCKWFIVDLKGAGNVEAENFKCEEADVDLKGAGNISVYASERVSADIKGMGNIDVYGNPKDVTKSDGWFSNISIH